MSTLLLQVILTECITTADLCFPKMQILLLSEEVMLGGVAALFFVSLLYVT